jgi:hypothetical protein
LRERTTCNPKSHKRLRATEGPTLRPRGASWSSRIRPHGSAGEVLRSAPSLRWRKSRRASPGGVAAGHEEPESRFLGRAPGSVVGPGAGVRSLGMTDRGVWPVTSETGGTVSYWMRKGLSFRGPATLHLDDQAAGCRAEESTVGSRGAGRGSPRHGCGRRESRTGPVRGVAAGHEEPESRFLGRAPGSVVGPGAGVRSPSE